MRHTEQSSAAATKFHSCVDVQVVGKLADKAPKAGMPLSGLLVRQGLRDTLLHPDDLATFTKLRTGTIKQTQSLLLARPWMQVLHRCLAHLNMCGATSSSSLQDKQVIKQMHTLQLASSDWSSCLASELSALCVT